MLPIVNPLTIEGYTVYQDDAVEIETLNALAHGGRPPAPAKQLRFYVLPKEPSLAKDDQGNTIFSLIVYRNDEQRLDATRALIDDVGGGILTFTIELTVPGPAMEKIRKKLRSMVYGDDTVDASADVSVSIVEFLDGKVSVAVAGETGADPAGEFTKGAPVGAGKATGIGSSRKAIMVKLTQKGAALMSSLDKLRVLPINIGYDLSFEHRLVGVTLQVWCDIESSYALVQTTIHDTSDYSDGYLSMSSNHVNTDKITSITETLTRNKTAGVEVIPGSSQVDADQIVALEKFGFDMLNNEMQKALQASPPPAEIDRTYLNSVTETYGQNFNFRLDRRMVLVRNYTPSVNLPNVMIGSEDAIAFVDLRTAFFSLLTVPVRVQADFASGLDTVVVTVSYTSKRVDGTPEQKVQSFAYTDGKQINTFIAFANSLENVSYDWTATAHYKNATGTFTFEKKNVKDQLVVVDVGQLGMLRVDVGIGLADPDKFPQAQVNLRYHSAALNRTLQSDFLLTKDTPSSVWTAVILEEWNQGYEYKVDWLRKATPTVPAQVIEGTWTHSDEQQLRLRSPISTVLPVKVTSSGKFGPDADALIHVAVSFRYSDLANDYLVEGTLDFTADNQTQDWTPDIINNQLTDYEYRYTNIYRGGLVKNFPPDGTWYKGEPGFIVVGERFGLQVELNPGLLVYSDQMKMVQVELAYDDAANNIHASDSYTFSKDDNAKKVWRVRTGDNITPGPYVVKYTYYSGVNDAITTPPQAESKKSLVIPPAPQGMIH